MRDEGNPVRSLIDSTRKCCLSLGGLVSSLISKHCTFLVGSLTSSSAEWEESHSTEMEPIDISSTDSDSDSWDLAKYKALNDRDDPSLMDSAASNNVTHQKNNVTHQKNNVRQPPPWASTSGTGVTGQTLTQKVPRSKKTSQFNGNSSTRDSHAQGRPQIHPSSGDNVRNSNSSITREDKSKNMSSNGYGRTLPSSLQASGSNGFGRTLPSSLQTSGSNGYGRTLSSSLQASGSNSRPISLDSAGNSRTHENPSIPPWSDPRYGKSLINDHTGRGRDAESSMFRRLPPSVHPNFIPTTPYVGPNDPLHRPAVVDEKIGDERLIYQAALQDLNQPKVEATLPKGLLSVPLLKHQKIALAWMHSKETKSAACRGGILADDQGLGKTISMLALIQLEQAQSKLKPDDSSTLKAEALNLDDDDDDKAQKTGESDDVKLIPQARTSTLEFKNRRPSAGTLVVCPASVVRQWAREMDEKVPEESKLSVLVYHGGNRTKSPDDLANYDVVVTTYAIVSNEVPKQPLVEEEDDQKNGDQYGLSSQFSSNKKRKALNTGKKGKKGRKGLDNCVADYDFGTLARVTWFRVILDEAQTIKNHRTLVARSCCGLKAKRRWCLSGTPIQNSIDELYSYFRFLKYEPYLVYKYFINNIKIPIARDSFRGYKKLQAVLKTVMLRRTKGTLLDGEPIINLPAKTINLTRVDFSTEEREFYAKLEGDSRSQFKAYAAAGTLKQNYANILLMLLRLRQACDHPLLVKGFNSDSVSRVSGKMAKRLPRDMQIDLLKHLETSLAICCVCTDPPEDAVVSICGHVFCYQCVSEYLTGEDNTCPSPECKEVLGVDAVFSKATLRRCISDNDDDDDDGNHSSSSNFAERSKVFRNEYSSSKIRAALEIIQTYCKKGQSLHNMDECNENSSNLENSSSGLGTEGPIKAIVFSQWTRMLDLVEMALNKNCIEYRRLDGSMSLASRDRAVKEFNTDPEVTVMLMSLKAGNLGLNMVAASHVILLDLWWNPTTEDQAIDRAHRIGQTRPVTVSRLTIKDTVEDRILALQEEKRKMVASAFGEDSSGATATRLTAEDLRYLFMGVP